MPYQGYLIQKNMPTPPSSDTRVLQRQQRTAAAVTRQLLKLVNSRLHNNQLPRASDFNLPYNKGEYIQVNESPAEGSGPIQAKEHRNAMQVLPHILHDIDDDLCRLAARYVDTHSVYILYWYFLLVFTYVSIPIPCYFTGGMCLTNCGTGKDCWRNSLTRI